MWSRHSPGCGRLAVCPAPSGPEFVVRYPDGYAAYVVGATFETSDVDGALSTDDAGETAALAWYPVEQLPAEINAYNRMLLRRLGLNV